MQTNSVNIEKDIPYTKLILSLDEKLKLIVLFTHAYDNTDQNVEQFAVEYNYVIHLLRHSKIPNRLEFLLVDEMKEDILNSLTLVNQEAFK